MNLSHIPKEGLFRKKFFKKNKEALLNWNSH